MRALAIVLLFVSLCFSAPAPLPPKFVHRREVVGVWRVKWAGSDWCIDFKKDGNYSGSCAISSWSGGWWVENGILRVEEYQINLNGTRGSKYEWKVKLQRNNSNGLEGLCNPPSPAVFISMIRG